MDSEVRLACCRLRRNSAISCCKVALPDCREAHWTHTAAERKSEIERRGRLCCPYPILSCPILSHRPSLPFPSLPACLPYLSLLEQDVLVGQTQRLLQRLHPHRSLLGPLLGIRLPVRGGPQQPLGRIHLQHSTAAAAMKAASDSTAQHRTTHLLLQRVPGGIQVSQRPLQLLDLSVLGRRLLLQVAHLAGQLPSRQCSAVEYTGL